LTKNSLARSQTALDLQSLALVRTEGLGKGFIVSVERTQKNLFRGPGACWEVADACARSRKSSKVCWRWLDQS